MGAAHATVINQSTRPLCVITFNMAELIYKSYHTLYIVMPGESQVVEANPDPIGLKVAIIYDTIHETQEFLFHRFTCKNDSVLTVTMIEGTDVDYYGEGTSLQAKGRLKEYDAEPFNMAASTLNHELASENANAHRFENAALAATQGVKKILNKVKDSSEAAIKTVTGKEIKFELGSLSGGGNNGFANSSRHSGVTPTNIAPPSPTQSLEDISQLTEDSAHYGMNGAGSGHGAATGGGFASHPISSLRGTDGPSSLPPSHFPSSAGYKPPLGGSYASSSSALPSSGSGQTGIAASSSSAAGKLFSNLSGGTTTSGGGGDWSATTIPRNGQGVTASHPPPPPPSSSGRYHHNALPTVHEERRPPLPTASHPPSSPTASLPTTSSAWAAAAGASSSHHTGTAYTSNGSSSLPPTQPSSQSAEEKFAAELERKKKEQTWEEEVRRIRREREEQARQPKKHAVPPPGAGGVQAGCQCVLS